MNGSLVLKMVIILSYRFITTRIKKTVGKHALARCQVNPGSEYQHRESSDLIKQAAGGFEFFLIIDVAD